MSLKGEVKWKDILITQIKYWIFLLININFKNNKVLISIIKLII